MPDVPECRSAHPSCSTAPHLRCLPCSRARPECRLREAKKGVPSYTGSKSSLIMGAVGQGKVLLWQHAVPSGRWSGQAAADMYEGANFRFATQGTGLRSGMAACRPRPSRAKRLTVSRTPGLDMASTSPCLRLARSRRQQPR